jgi:hypothetical protein
MFGIMADGGLISVLNQQGWCKVRVKYCDSQCQRDVKVIKWTREIPCSFPVKAPLLHPDVQAIAEDWTFLTSHEY